MTELEPVDWEDLEDKQDALRQIIERLSFRKGMTHRAFLFVRLKVREGLEAVVEIEASLNELIDLFYQINLNYIESIPEEQTSELAPVFFDAELLLDKYKAYNVKYHNHQVLKTQLQNFMASKIHTVKRLAAESQLKGAIVEKSSEEEQNEKEEIMESVIELHLYSIEDSWMFKNMKRHGGIELTNRCFSLLKSLHQLKPEQLKKLTPSSLKELKVPIDLASWTIYESINFSFDYNDELESDQLLAEYNERYDERIAELNMQYDIIEKSYIPVIRKYIEFCEKFTQVDS